MVNRQWAELKAVTRTPLVRMRALDVLQPDGSSLRVTEGANVLSMKCVTMGCVNRGRARPILLSARPS